MKNSKHTPGPWMYNIEGNILGPVTNATGGYSEADARLITASPEMLEALETILHDAENAGHPMEFVLNDIKETAQKAIAKARGEA